MKHNVLNDPSAADGNLTGPRIAKKKRKYTIDTAHGFVRVPGCVCVCVRV